MTYVHMYIYDIPQQTVKFISSSVRTSSLATLCLHHLHFSNNKNKKWRWNPQRLSKRSQETYLTHRVKSPKPKINKFFCFAKRPDRPCYPLYYCLLFTGFRGFLPWGKEAGAWVWPICSIKCTSIASYSFILYSGTTLPLPLVLLSKLPYASICCCNI